MKFEEYLENTKRTWKKFLNQEKNIQHALLGLIDESGELANQYKGNLAYDKPLLVHEGKGCVKEELGDMFYFLTRFADEMSFASDKKMVDALQAILDDDYSEKFTGVNKDVNAIGICLYLAAKSGGMHIALSTEDGGIIMKAIQEMMFGMCMLAHYHEIKVTDILEGNINKLKARFPEQFDADKAVNRDTDAEMEALNKKSDE
jgi:NTP pyrophosphatase (non-canonical NTP hydrolase)